MAFDCETKDGLRAKELYCYSLAWIEKSSHKIVSKQIEVKNNLDLKFLFKKIDNSNDKSHKRIIYVHNLGFDVRFIINYCVRKNLEYKTLMSGSQIIGLSINEMGVVFRDSAQYLQSSQEQAEIDYEIDEELRKIDCSDLFIKDFKLWSRKDKNRVLEHNGNDTKALLSIMIKYRQIMFEIGGVDILTTHSLASLSLKIFRTTIKKPILNPFVFTKWNKEYGRLTYKYDKQREQFVRKSYFGGRTEVFNMNLQKNAKYVDRVSMYPAEMFYNYFPNGIPIWVNTNSILLKNNKKLLLDVIKDNGIKQLDYIENEDNIELEKYFFVKKIDEKYYVERIKYQFEGFIECNIIPKKLKFPVLAQRLDNKLMFTNCKRKGVYSLPELRYAYKLGYEIEPLKALLFADSDDIFSVFIKKLFIIKSTHQGGKKKSAKIGMNSSYGKFGQAFERTAPIMHYFNSDDEMIDFIAQHPNMKKYKAIHNKETNLRVVYEIVDNISIKPFMNVVIASYITSNSRVSLEKQMYKVDEYNEELFYTDSDSLTIQNIDLSKFNMSKQLGGWDIEQTFDFVKFLAPKCYIAIVDGKPFLKMKGVDRDKIKEIVETSNTIEEIEEKIRKPIQIAERYLTYREAHRYGLILGTKKRVKHYSFENWKRNFKNGLSIAWDDETLPEKFKNEK